jgi:hypothetical protein
VEAPQQPLTAAAKNISKGAKFGKIVSARVFNAMCEYFCGSAMSTHVFEGSARDQVGGIWISNELGSIETKPGLIW